MTKTVGRGGGRTMGPVREMMNNQRRRTVAILVFAVIVVLGIAGILFYVSYEKSHVSTDDAFVAGKIHVIASKVPGTVKVIHVHDNQSVKQGDLLVEIDTQDYDVRVREAESALGAESSKLAEISSRVEVTQKQLREFEHRLESARASLKLQEANLKQAELDLTRAQRLYKKEILPEEKLEKAKTTFAVAGAQVDAAREQLKQAEASLETQRAVIRQTDSAYQAQGSVVRQRQEVKKAEDLKKSYTRIHAPSDGYVTKKSLEVGNQIQAGQPLMAVVPLGDVWVVANYKETQLERVRAGQKVTIRVDTYPGKSFDGVVDSIMAGTGSVFSLFPPENATGNFVKVVQRIPVKIVLKKGADPEHVLRVGMSVEPTILIDK
jgi:membrane fusion protein (multidrug efflux system)